MSKIVLSLLMVIVLSFGVIGCGYSSSDFTEVITEHGNWKIVRSPKTGLCYEVIIAPNGYQGYLGMSPVDCDHLR